jgi:hypothetical protein
MLFLPRDRLDGQHVILDHRIGEQVLADRLKLCAGRGHIVAIKFQLDALPDMGLLDGGDAEVLDGAANRVPLRVEDAFAWADDDLGSDHGFIFNGASALLTGKHENAARQKKNPAPREVC